MVVVSVNWKIGLQSHKLLPKIKGAVFVANMVLVYITYWWLCVHVLVILCWFLFEFYELT